VAVPGHRLDRMWNPRTVVVIGDKGPGYMWIHSNLPFKERGGNFYSVQIDEKEIEGIEALGVKNFKSLSEVPEPIDYAVVAVPRQVSPYVLKDLLAVGAAGGAFFTSGFAETGEELGIKLQQALTEMAREGNFNLVGPNCMGLYCPRLGVRYNAEAPVTEEGTIGFLSQSGTHAINFTLVAAASGLYLSRAASLGNAIILDVPDYLEYLALDDDTKVIGMYVEGVKDGRRFFETLKMACQRKPVVVWKGGQTQAGTRATQSHTASLATDHAVWEAMVRQAGAISTNNLDETVDVMRLLVQAKPLPGRRLALLAQTGGQSVSITDAFARQGFEVPRFSQKTYDELGEFFNIVGGSYQNPLDMAGTIQGKVETLERILRIVDADPNVDAMVMELSAMFAARQWKKKPESLDELLDILKAHAERSEKTFIAILHPAHEEEYVGSIRPKFAERGLPVFHSFDRAAAALARVERVRGAVYWADGARATDRRGYSTTHLHRPEGDEGPAGNPRDPHSGRSHPR
jgi:acyl-CoA synthetase (NDP forming)